MRVDHELWAYVLGKIYVVTKVWYNKTTDQVHFRASHGGQHVDMKISLEVLQDPNAREMIAIQMMKKLEIA